MLKMNIDSFVESKIKFYEQEIDNPNAVNGFNGTWAISDHAKLPEVFFGFVQRYFNVSRIKRVPIEEINTLLNSLWEGPGSLEKIFRLENELYITGKDIKLEPVDKIKDRKDAKEADLPLSNYVIESDPGSEE
jgi:hypothetical protein